MTDQTPELSRNYWRAVSAIIALAIVVSLIWSYYVLISHHPPLLVVSNPVPIENTDLCPGDKLVYTIDLQSAQSGTYTLNATVWHLDPLYAAAVDPTIRFVVPFKKEWTVTREWQIEPLRYDPRSGELRPWEPGTYARAVSAGDDNREADVSIVQVPFTIAADCPQPQESKP